MSTITLQIARGDIQTGQTMEEHQVPYSEGMSLLDAILWLREHVDPSIAVRYSCRSANACKECSASIDGKVDYLCSTRAVAESTVAITPLSGREWIKDLATDLE